jgi:hypothetical protein
MDSLKFNPTPECLIDGQNSSLAVKTAPIQAKPAKALLN